MILRLSDSLSRALVVVLSLLVAAWLIFFGVRAAKARYEADRETPEGLEVAVRWEPGNPDYWYRLGRYRQYNLEQPDSSRAEESYGKALSLDPLYTEAWLDLATAEELDGRSKQARESYLQAKKSQPISADVSWRYGNFLLREGDLPQAYAELRRAIEADPRRGAAAFSRAFRANPNIEEILDQLLPPDPRAYVGVIGETVEAKQLAVAMTVWARLLALHPHLQLAEFDGLVTALLQAGEYTAARRIWNEGVATMNLPPLLQPLGTVIWDPSFESLMNDSSFAWSIKPLLPGVSLRYDNLERLSGHQSLRLGFDGKHNPNLEAACTLAIVQPATTYQFSGWIKTKDLNTDEGIRFRLRSLDDPRLPVVTTSDVHGTNPWTLVEQAWTAAPGTHRVEVCITRKPSENAGLRISGIAWVDDVNLLPQPVESHKR